MLKYQTFLEKLAGRIGTLRGPVLARGPEFGDRWSNSSPLSIPEKRFARLIRHLQFRFWCLSS